MRRECDEALAGLYQYLDAELDAATNERIRRHLDKCPECMGPYEFESRLRTVVRERLGEDVPQAFTARLLDALREASGAGTG